MIDSTDNRQVAIDDEATDLPALRTWPAVYAFVLVTFVVWVALLTALSRAFL
ncbi:MAG TPA: hypothetical protein VFE46_18130 [Pirellulales bacterium]|jgi:hypothetical protein|nr:hypothetical protein [Pirellulales bacterium]